MEHHNLRNDKRTYIIDVIVTCRARGFQIAMNFHQIRIFISVAEHLSFTKAAEDFYTSQPTISRQIALLEEEWGLPLFIRTTQEVRLTPEGTIMLQACRDVTARIKDGLEDVRKMREGQTGSIRIGCPEVMDTTLFIRPVTAHFSQRYPEIEIMIEKLPFYDLLVSLSSGELDIVFTIDFDLKNMNEIAFNSFIPTQGLILMSRNHPLAVRKNLKIIDFSEETFLLPEEKDYPDRKNNIQHLCRTHGFECRKITYLKNMESVLLQVQAGKGVAVLDTSIININDSKVFACFMLPLETASISIAYGWKKENLNPALALYINTLMEIDQPGIQKPQT